jgi:hypothetical protein
MPRPAQLALTLFSLTLVIGFKSSSFKFGQQQDTSEALQDYAEVVALPAKVTSTPNVASDRETRCRSLHTTHNVLVGRSWGSLNKEQIAEWMKIRCDPFFCKPDALEGKGIYKCVPL